jgi:predicted transcriptional regulator
MSQGDVYIHEFNNLESYLKKLYKIEKHVSFYDLIDKAKQKSSVIRNYESFLKSAGTLRNAIIHGKEYPYKLIAEPNEEFVEEFIRINSAIQKPKLVSNLGSKNFHIYKIEDKLEDALRAMHENDYSQILYELNSRHFLITREGISKWLEANFSNDIVSLKEITLEAISKYEEESNWCFLSRNTDIYEAKEKFADAQRKIQAIIVTQNGKNTERPLSIITHWDIGEEFYAKLER